MIKITVWTWGHARGVENTQTTACDYWYVQDGILYLCKYARPGQTHEMQEDQCIMCYHEWLRLKEVGH